MATKRIGASASESEASEVRLQLLTAVLLVTVTFAQADEGQRCVTVEAGSNAVEAFYR